MTFTMRFLGPVVLLFSSLFFGAQVTAQTGTLHGAVLDPSGAAVPGAQIALSQTGKTFHTQSGRDGLYAFRQLAPGVYALSATAKGFAPLTVESVRIAAGQTKELNLPLQIAVEHENVTVSEQNQEVGLQPDENASASVLRGRALDAFSDDPDELQNELEALAGPAAGPNGGQIYIDGFAGGRLPPKSSILEVRVNQNPFSAEFDRLGYGRVEIFTRPGSEKLNGSLGGEAVSSALDTANPLVAQQPSYYQYSIVGNVSGPIGKKASYFLSAFRVSHQDQAMVDAVNPEDASSSIRRAFPTPITYVLVAPRVDFQAGSRGSVTIHDMFYRTYQTGTGVGTLNLQSQASNVLSEENQLQIGETFLANSRFVNETHFQWSHIYNDQVAVNSTPTVIVQGAFTNGGSSAGIARDTQDNFELQNDSTATAGAHALRFGVHLRAYDDRSFSTAGRNGTYYFSSVAAYQARTPTQYAAAVISNPLARVLLFDGALYVQDDWHWKPNLVIGAGVRVEGQNRIHDPVDWAPRLALAWSPGRNPGAHRPATILRAGYGWFYDRFTVPSFFSADSGTPYLMQTLHDNRINQQSYVVDNPGFYDPTTPAPPALLIAEGTPSYHSVDRHFHAALDMQMGVGVDRQVTKNITANVTYLYTQGVHQYLTNTVNAPAFDPSTYTVVGSAPDAYNYQFQSGGFYRQNQLIFTASFQSRRWVINGTYLVNEAKSDTQGITSAPSVAQNPGFDYGRAGFGYRHRLSFINSYTGPHGIVIATMLFARSGLPYNLTIGSNLTGNQQFNARPAYGVCGATGVVPTRYGCLDTDPVGKGERIVPYGVGTGPNNVIFHLRVSKVIGLGPRLERSEEGDTYSTGSTVSGRGLSGGSTSVPMSAAASRRYNLTLAAVATNLFNIVNLGPPNGVLLSPHFGESQSLGTGSFGSPTPGNRAITLQTTFSF